MFRIYHEEFTNKLSGHLINLKILHTRDRFENITLTNHLMKKNVIYN